MFKKYLNKHYIQAYKEIYIKVNKFFKAVPVDTNSYTTVKPIIRLEISLKKLNNIKITTRPKKSFIARINKLTNYNT